MTDIEVRLENGLMSWIVEVGVLFGSSVVVLL